MSSESDRDFKNAYAIVLAKLTRRDHTEKELTRALRLKLVPESAIERAILKAREQGLVDDRKFADRRARSAASVLAKGPRRVKVALRAKGVPGAAAEAAVAEAYRPSAEMDEKLARLAERLWRRARADSDKARKVKVLRSLMARGFDLRSARWALDVALNASMSENRSDEHKNADE